MSDKALDSEVQAMQAALDAMAELKPEEQKRVLEWLATKLHIVQPDFEQPPTTNPAGKSGAISGNSPDSKPSAKDFMKEKNPQSGVERIACLAYYLAHHENIPAFKKKDLDKLNTLAAQTVSIKRSDIANAQRASQFLATAGSGQQQISAKGEALVEALPDRKMVLEAMKQHPIKRGRKRSKQTPKNK